MATEGTSDTKVANRRAAPGRARSEVVTEAIRLSARDSRRVLKDLASPPAPNAKVKRAAGRYKRTIAKNR